MENNIRSDMERMEEATMMLKTEVNRASSLWKDEKYLELRNTLSKLADKLLYLLDSGRYFSDSVAEFDKICDGVLGEYRRG